MWSPTVQATLLIAIASANRSPLFPAVAASAAWFSMANKNLAVWEKLGKVTTLVEMVCVMCHLGRATGTENAPRQNPWLT